MKIITKKNFFSVLCCTYTLLSLFGAIIEGIVYGKLNNTQLNLLTCFIISLIAVGILSQHYRFENIPLLAVIVLQYIVAVGIVFVLLWILGHFIEMHPNGYRDMFFSFTIPYVIGAFVYYGILKSEVKRQNQLLNELKKADSYQKNIINS